MVKGKEKRCVGVGRAGMAVADTYQKMHYSQVPAKCILHLASEQMPGLIGPQGLWKWFADFQPAQ